MENTAGYSTILPLALQRTCFTSEQDRLNEYAKALRVPVQTGAIIKGDKGDAGQRGPTGARGPKGDTGAAGQDATTVFAFTDYPIAATDTTVLAVGDQRLSVFILIYDEESAPPPSDISIMHIRYNGADTVVTLSGAAPDNNFILRVLAL